MNSSGNKHEALYEIHLDRRRSARGMRLAGDGVEAVGTTPEQFARYLHQEIAKWGKVVKLSGATVD